MADADKPLADDAADSQGSDDGLSPEPMSLPGNQPADVESGQLPFPPSSLSPPSLSSPSPSSAESLALADLAPTPPVERQDAAPTAPMGMVRTRADAMIPGLSADAVLAGGKPASADELATDAVGPSAAVVSESPAEVAVSAAPMTSNGGMATNDLLNVYRREIRAKQQVEHPEASVEALREEGRQEAEALERRAKQLRARRRQDAAMRTALCVLVFPPLLYGAAGINLIMAGIVAIYVGVMCWHCQRRGRSHIFGGISIGGGCMVICLASWVIGAGFTFFPGFFALMLVTAISMVVCLDQRDHWTTV